jgi:hypothetical protein
MRAGFEDQDRVEFTDCWCSRFVLHRRRTTLALGMSKSNSLAVPLALPWSWILFQSNKLLLRIIKPHEVITRRNLSSKQIYLLSISFKLQPDSPSVQLPWNFRRHLSLYCHSPRFNFPIQRSFAENITEARVRTREAVRRGFQQGQRQRLIALYKLLALLTFVFISS